MKFLRFFFFLFSIFIVFSCGGKKLQDDELKSYLNDLEELENILKKDFGTISNLMENAAEFTSQLYSRPIKNIPPNDIYEINENGVMYKKRNDGKSAIFVSGFHKVDDIIKRNVYITEPLDSIFKAIIDFSHKRLDSNIVQVYYNDRFSYNRIYPYLDVLVQFEPKIDITKFNFYYLADINHNPEKKAVWILEPYVDPAGRGWMISCIAPVYHNDTLEGVLGVDITIKNIISKYLNGKHNDVMIITKSGTIVAVNKYISDLLLLPPFEEHKYFGTIKENTLKSETHKVSNHKIKEFREYYNKLISEELVYYYIDYNRQNYHFISNTIPEFSWILVKTLITN